MSFVVGQRSAAQNFIRPFKTPLPPKAGVIGRTASVANNIVKFTRPAIAVGKGALAAKAALAVAAFGVGYLIGTALKNMWDSLNNPSKLPADAKPVVPEGTWQLDVPESGNALLYLSWTERVTRGTMRTCGNNQFIQGPIDKVDGPKSFPVRIYGPASVSQRTASYNTFCSSSSGGDYRQISLGTLTYVDSDGSTKTRGIRSAVDGYSNGSTYYTAPQVSTVQLSNFIYDGKPIPNPIPEPSYPPTPRPTPVPTPEADPSMVPEKPKIIPPLKPAPITVPDSQPTTEPQPAPVTPPGRPPVKVPTKVPTITPTPDRRPSQVPNPTPITNKGELAPPKTTPIKTTDPRDHIIKNGGGRISGRTASANPVQIAQEVARIEQKAANISKGNLGNLNLGDLINLVRALLDILTATTPGTTYQLQAVCECDPDAENCEEPKMTKEIPSVFWGDASIARLDAIAELLQPLKTWKQPICKPQYTPEGNWRTIQFKSDEEMPSGRRFLTKTFRYRSKGSQLLENVVNHWKDFVWQAGPVCVINKNGWWGVPQVWAASEAEGKRVIRHAATEAGIDLEKTEWVVTSSKNPRYGNQGTMRVRIYRNASCMWYGITNRDNSDARPLVQEYLPSLRAVAIDDVE